METSYLNPSSNIPPAYQSNIDSSSENTASSVEGAKNNKIVKAEGQSSKKWYVIAILVGFVILFGGTAFAATGLLQAHHFLTLPAKLHQLASALGTIGHTPGNWSLWAIGGGSALVGFALVIYGSYKIDKARQKDRPIAIESVDQQAIEKLETDLETTKNQLSTKDQQLTRLSGIHDNQLKQIEELRSLRGGLQKELNEANDTIKSQKQKFTDMLSELKTQLVNLQAQIKQEKLKVFSHDNVEFMQLNPENYKDLNPQNYELLHYTNEETQKSEYIIVLNKNPFTQKGELVCTTRIDKNTMEELIQALAELDIDNDTF